MEETFTFAGKTYDATPRDKLFALIQAIADQKPRSIGVDIDFSAHEGDKGYRTLADPKFFQDRLDIAQRKQHPVPIVLGIRRSQIYAPEYWLGVADYKDLAASIFLPHEDTRKLWSWIKPDKTSAGIRTMSWALAEKLDREEQQIPYGLGWMVHEFSDRDLGHEYFVSEYLVDYSLLDSLELTKVRTTDPAGIRAQAHLLDDKVVLIGRATLGEAKDIFPVAVRPQGIPGVYLHAAGAYTLATAPLYELTEKGRWILDIVLSLVILAAIKVIRLFFVTRTTSAVNAHWLQTVFTILVVGLAWAVGVFFVTTTRVLWDDFPLVTAGLLLHPKVESWFARLGNFINKELRPMLRRIILPEKKEGEP
jgi:hypothetical protein